MALPHMDQRRKRPFRFLYMPIQAFINRFLLRREGASLASRPVPDASKRGFQKSTHPTTSSEPVLWKSGIGRIDQQHEDMFHAIHALQTALKAGEGARGVAEVMAFLERYMSDHFILEEAYMERLQFPDLAEHREAHSYFRQQVQELGNRLDQGDTSLNLELTTMLYGWLREHILKMDMEYSNFAQAKHRH